MTIDFDAKKLQVNGQEAFELDTRRAAKSHTLFLSAGSDADLHADPRRHRIIRGIRGCGRRWWRAGRAESSADVFVVGPVTSRSTFKRGRKPLLADRVQPVMVVPGPVVVLQYPPPIVVQPLAFSSHPLFVEGRRSDTS